MERELIANGLLDKRWRKSFPSKVLKLNVGTAALLSIQMNTGALTPDQGVTIAGYSNRLL